MNSTHRSSAKSKQTPPAQSAPTSPAPSAPLTPPVPWVNPLIDPEDRRMPRIAGPCALVFFGVSGDLSRKKLLPAVYDLANRGLLPPGFGLVGVARRDYTDAQFAEIVKQDVRENARTPFREETWKQLVTGIRFVWGDFDDEGTFKRLRSTLDELDNRQGADGNHAFYLSVPPRMFEVVVDQLEKFGMVDQSQGWKRVVIEKPFGHDLASAKDLYRAVSKAFPPESVFRIDHYLGKETVQNLLALRFANQMFEPIWNNNYVGHVQITMAEDIGIGGRAGYYDGIGAARDVIQNHLLQLMALTAMEEPNSFEANQISIEKQKILAAATTPRNLDIHTARGQYAEGWQGGQLVPGYLQEKGIPSDSHTETYAAIRVDLGTRRWAGVPFYLRAAKRMPRRVTEVALVFKRAPHLPFTNTETSELGTNALVMRIQPNEGVSMHFGAKAPATAMEIRQVSMDFAYADSFNESIPEAYERLILDVLLGEPPLFPRQEEVELSWQLLDPVLQHWAEQGPPEQYASGTWGPNSGIDMLKHDGFTWRRP
ncbi:Glucose-6-phosphate 1-dehydrogenase Zwf [Propionibacterium freudenreichii]|nr:Glucose-6-phosphate 1-dehydrogenase Zwf [Propionibacterium freudenreichii]SCQ67904.1 Glucose-6-phosphate 1-dehydrogenase Zwf [Propionibacterium freudenreichii]SCQ72145.1 Glucose-6-phosphate 1-dehydrogenase Zwf [Propionibacterium freudenreichii]SCQ80575.1 Glucose-6-phosphate 1-dehydrogenase Zwf [Propionibacterium freudenreichii]